MIVLYDFAATLDSQLTVKRGQCLELVTVCTFNAG